ncbi:hypothetical protein [Brevibacterium zhoupengii]|uniref:hypothetical protein n=1 Tax=Brevibacterium zhoupengii TaxID=2898795 RepID=UPI001F0A0447|nr:hypothetical protein [Brevibacterium zhoupengii]
MSRSLDAKQTIALRTEDRESISQQARSRRIGNGLLARACLRYGLQRIDSPEFEELVAEEAADERERISAAGRANVARRWDAKDNDKENDYVQQQEGRAHG